MTCVVFWRILGPCEVRQHELSKPKRKIKGKEIQGLRKFITKLGIKLTGAESW